MRPRRRTIHGLKSVSLHQNVIGLAVLVGRMIYRAMFLRVVTLLIEGLLRFALTTALLAPEPDALTMVVGDHDLALGIARHLLRDNHDFTRFLLFAVVST